MRLRNVSFRLRNVSLELSNVSLEQTNRLGVLVYRHVDQVGAPVCSKALAGAPVCSKVAVAIVHPASPVVTSLGDNGLE